VSGPKTGDWFEGKADDKQYRERVGAHEAGHFMGLDDGYKYDINRNGIFDKDGNLMIQDGVDGCNIMASMEGTPDPGDIAKILGSTVDGKGRGYLQSRQAPSDPQRDGYGPYGSLTKAAASWEATWGDGGWLSVARKQMPGN
jgi:hypothetical protein